MSDMELCVLCLDLDLITQEDDSHTFNSIISQNTVIQKTIFQQERSKGSF